MSTILVSLVIHFTVNMGQCGSLGTVDLGISGGAGMVVDLKVMMVDLGISGDAGNGGGP